ncbi:MAG TPA: phosphatidylglycerophosphatase A [Acidimicrobiia bacterium]|nr:phosphatidylglycerophosphatase A [Acidimicrobiia bacterium]
MHRVVASWFGTGLILGRIRGEDVGSGTVGAIFALPIAVLIGEWWGWQGQLLAALVVTAAALWSIRPFVRPEGDAGWIVVDEAAGAFVAVIGLPFWPYALIAWIVFRAADIFKTAAPGVARAEDLPGAVGVTADDLVAGLYGLAVGHGLLALF